MKKLIKCLFFISLFVFATGTAFAKLPSYWITDADEPSSFDKSLDDTLEIEKESRIYDNILDAKSSMLEESVTKNKGKKRWYLQSIMTELGIEAGGGIGVLAMKGEAFAKLIWIRSPEAIAKLQKKVYGTADSSKNLEEKALESELAQNDKDHNIAITSDMSKDSLEREVTAITSAGFKSGKIKNPGIVRKKIMEKVTEFQTVMKDMESYPMTQSWYPYKFQLDLVFDISGKWSVVNVGSDFRVRLEWFRVMRKGSKVETNPNAQMSSNTKFLLGLAEDFSSVDKLAIKGSNSFYLSHLAVKVGMFAKGKIGVAKVKGKIIGGVFFKKSKNALMNKANIESPSDSLLSLDSTFPVYVLDEANGANKSLLSPELEGRLHKASRKKFRKQLKKVEKMANFVSRGALRREKKLKKRGKTPNFNLNFIELELEIVLSGGVGAVTVGGQAEIEFFFSRRGI